MELESIVVSYVYVYHGIFIWKISLCRVDLLSIKYLISVLKTY